MRSFAIEDPGSPDPPLYATLHKSCLELFSHALVLVVFKLLNRDPLAPRGSPGPESDLLSNLLGGANAPVENPVR